NGMRGLAVFRKRRERALDFFLRRFAGCALRVLLRLFGEVDDVVARDAHTISGAVHERRGPALKELGVLRFTRQADNDGQVDGLRRGWHCERQQSREDANADPDRFHVTGFRPLSLVPCHAIPTARLYAHSAEMSPSSTKSTIGMCHNSRSSTVVTPRPV